MEDTVQRLRIFVSLVMIAQLSTYLVRLSGLEQSPDSGWAAPRIVESSCEFLELRGGNTRNAERVVEYSTVDGGVSAINASRGDCRGSLDCPASGRRARAVRRGRCRLHEFGLEEFCEHATFPQARVLTVETKEGADDEDWGLVMAVAAPSRASYRSVESGPLVFDIGRQFHARVAQALQVRLDRGEIRRKDGIRVRVHGGLEVVLQRELRGEESLMQLEAVDRLDDHRRVGGARVSLDPRPPRVVDRPLLRRGSLTRDHDGALAQPCAPPRHRLDESHLEDYNRSGAFDP